MSEPTVAAWVLATYRELWAELLPPDGRDAIAAGLPITLVRDLHPFSIAANPDADDMLMVQVELNRVLGSHVMAANAVNDLDDMFVDTCQALAVNFKKTHTMHVPWAKPWSYLSQIDMQVYLRGLNITNEDYIPEPHGSGELDDIQTLHHSLTGWLLCVDDTLLVSDPGVEVAAQAQVYLSLLVQLRAIATGAV